MAGCGRLRDARDGLSGEGAGAGTGSLRGDVTGTPRPPGSLRRDGAPAGDVAGMGTFCRGSLRGDVTSPGEGDTGTPRSWEAVTETPRSPERRHGDAGNVTETPGTSRRRQASGGSSGVQVRPVALFSRIEQPLLHSKGLTDEADVTSHEGTWSSIRLPHVFPALPGDTRAGHAPPRGPSRRNRTSRDPRRRDPPSPARSPPPARTLGGPPAIPGARPDPRPSSHDPAISEAATACQGRRRNRRVL